MTNFIVKLKNEWLQFKEEEVELIFIEGTRSNSSMEPGYEKILLRLFLIKNTEYVIKIDAKDNHEIISKIDAITFLKSYLSDWEHQLDVLEAFKKLNYQLPGIERLDSIYNSPFSPEKIFRD